MPSSPEILKAKAIKAITKLPALSPLIGKLLFRTSSECGLDSIGRLVEGDPTLGVEFLHLANSGFYARGRRITSVRHAVALIGLGAVRRYALTHSVSRLFARLRPAPSFPLTLFNLHSTAVGALADLVAAELPTPDRESAFAAGLFHDFGRLLLAVTAQQEYESVLALSVISDRSMLECEREVCGIDHVELTCVALDQMGIPLAVKIAVEHGHKPEQDPWSRLGIVPLSAVLCQADLWVNTLGISVAPRGFKAGPECLEFPGYPYSRATVLERFQAELSSLAVALGYKGQLNSAAPPVRDVVDELTAPRANRAVAAHIR